MTTELNLFEVALGVQKPWFIESVSLDLPNNKVNIHINFEKRSEFTYTDEETNETGVYKAYDTGEKTWRHMNLFQYPCYLHCRTPRVKISSGKVRQVKTPWEGTSSGFTLLFEAWIIQLVKVMPANQVCNMMGLYDSKVWDMLYQYTEKCREYSDFSKVKSVGMDKTSISGHNYITTFVDMAEKKTLFVTEGKDSATVKAFADYLKEHKGDVKNITEASCDVSRIRQGHS